jgi:hypothetical protein
MTRTRRSQQDFMAMLLPLHLLAKTRFPPRHEGLVFSRMSVRLNLLLDSYPLSKVLLRLGCRVVWQKRAWSQVS